MTNTIKVAVISALLMAGVAQSNAATAPAKTNWVAPLNFTLTAYTNGLGKAAYTIATKQVIQQFLVSGVVASSTLSTNTVVSTNDVISTNTAYSTNNVVSTNEVYSTNADTTVITTNITYSTNIVYGTNFTFSTNLVSSTNIVHSTNTVLTTNKFSTSAKLLVKQTAGVSGVKYIVRDTVNHKSVDFDVTPYFTQTNFNAVGTTGAKSTTYALSSVWVDGTAATNAGSIDLSGMAIEGKDFISKTVTNGSVLKSFSSTVGGQGTAPASTNLVILGGTVKVSGGSAE